MINLGFLTTAFVRPTRGPTEQQKVNAQISNGGVVSMDGMDKITKAANREKALKFIGSKHAKKKVRKDSGVESVAGAKKR